MKKDKVLIKFVIKDSNSWSGAKYLNKECEIYYYDFDDLFNENKPSKVVVSHNINWDIYSSTTFEKEVTKLIKAEKPKLKIKRITFSEQGMQEDLLADMDIEY